MTATTDNVSPTAAGPDELRISVIMPVYNGVEYIVRSLPPLIDMQRRGVVSEVIVVDDSSTDATAQLSREMGARVIPSGGRLGPGAARNIAAEQAVGEVLWFVDADVIVHDNAVQYLQEGFADTGIVAVFGSYDDRPPAENFLSQYKNLVHHYYHHRGRREANTFWSGCGAVLKEAFLKVGGFDVVRYVRPSIEDIELGYRLREAGGKILLIPQLQSTHLKVWRFVNLIHTEVFCRAIPWARLMFERTGLVDDLNTGRGERLRALLSGLLLLALLSSLAGVLAWWIPLLLFAGAIAVNLSLFRLFLQRKGLLFALLGLAFHQIYYLYSGFAFAYSWLEWKLVKPAGTQAG
jgi:glycosyltransferase involved in cell wall biosynthesis